MPRWVHQPSLLLLLLLFLLMAAVTVVAPEKRTSSTSFAHHNACAVFEAATCVSPLCNPRNNNNSNSTYNSIHTTITKTTTNNQQHHHYQCLPHILQESHKDKLCSSSLSPSQRRAAMANLRLRYCCERQVLHSLPETVFHDTKNCHFHLQQLLNADEIAGQATCSYIDILQRFDCDQKYSIAHNCEHCKIAYRRWVCSELVPYYKPNNNSNKNNNNNNGGSKRIPPCLHICQDVEQRCPYLLPDQTLTPSEAAHPTPQYAGEPNFLCVDTRIPRLRETSDSSIGGDEDCCYTHCGAPGRGKGGGILDVCEHCPGRPTSSSSNNNNYIVAAAAAAAGGGDATSLTTTTATTISLVVKKTNNMVIEGHVESTTINATTSGGGGILRTSSIKGSPVVPLQLMWWTFLLFNLRHIVRTNNYYLNDYYSMLIIGAANNNNNNNHNNYDLPKSVDERTVLECC